MEVSYNKLFKLLIDKGMKKTELRRLTGISPNTLTKLSNHEFVSMEVLVKICRTLSCDIGDIVEVVARQERELKEAEDVKHEQQSTQEGQNVHGQRNVLAQEAAAASTQDGGRS